jgi:hypothetical protein
LLDDTDTKVAITKSITALKQNEPTTQASIKIPQAVATIAERMGEWNIEYATVIGKISSGEMPFIERVRISA